jgi:hypothetical protein
MELLHGLGSLGLFRFRNNSDTVLWYSTEFLCREIGQPQGLYVHRTLNHIHIHPPARDSNPRPHCTQAVQERTHHKPNGYSKKAKGKVVPALN